MSSRRRATHRGVGRARIAVEYLRWFAFIVLGAGILTGSYALGLTIKAIFAI